MAKYKYMNLSGMPIRVPHKKGCSIEFAPGSGSNDEWFSRFAGKGMPLTKMDLMSTEKEAPKPVRMNPFAPIAATFEDKGDYNVSSSGIFRCKHCEEYQTGSERSMLIHLEMIHKIKQDGLPKIEAPVIDLTEPVVEENDTPETTEETVEQPQQETFKCNLCGKVFTSDKGLKTHMTRMHKVEL